ncbi:uncharacterized protein [Leptinotarsa decemlineata]|uniref:uncharacterized protein n=1 Tax=Leptinotarsa decemlineata TaxID=7539 RepID=UPI003D307A4A
MKSSIIIFVLSSLWIVEGSNITEAKNKTKRNLSGDIQNYGESNIVWLNPDKHSLVLRNANVYFPNVRPASIIEEPSSLVKVSTEQVLNEFDQSPTNAGPSVQLKQLFQPGQNFNQELSGQAYKPFLHNNAPNVVSTSSFNQDIAGQGYKPFLHSSSPSVLSQNNFNHMLGGAAHKPFLQNSASNVVASNNFNQELAAPAYKPLLQNTAATVMSQNNYNPGVTVPAYKPILQNNAPSVVGSETIVTPVQHGHLVQNNLQPFNSFKLHPLYNVQPQYAGPKKYIYVNGRFIYDPNTPHFQNPQTFYHSSQQFPQRQPIVNYNHPGVPRQNLVPPSAHPLLTQSRFQPPPKSQQQPINIPSTAPPNTGRQQKKPEHREEEKPVEENKEEEDKEENNEENEEYYQHEDDSDNYEGPERERYSFDDDDEDHHLSLRDHDDIEDDDEDDSNRGSTRHVTKVNKYPKKFYKSGKKDEIIYGSRYEYPEKKHPRGSAKKQSMRYKSYKYSKDSDQEGIEGKQSQHVPVTHKQKIFKEKWYLSKSSADREGYDD